MKLHIGCGHDYKEGWVNLDTDYNVRADIYCDGADMPDNWTNKITEIYSHHSLEHFPDLFQIVDEMARVSMDGAKWIHTVPYCTWTQGWGNAHHHILFHENTFRFFDKGPNGIHKRREQDYSITTDKVVYGWNGDVRGWPQYKDELWDDLKNKYLNVVKEITFYLTCHK